MSSKGEVLNAENQTIASSEIKTRAKFFETKHFRTKVDFDNLTDPSGLGNSIKIGPEDKKDISMTKLQGYQRYLGFVGLKDYENDLIEDPYMTFEGGYDPQIIMNFSPSDPISSTSMAFKNESSAHVSPDPIPVIDGWPPVPGDSWAKKLFPNYQSFSALNYLDTGERFPKSSAEKNDLSPFNGVRLSARRHGEFVYKTLIPLPDNPFQDSLYWRPNDWLKSYGQMIGKAFSKGLMTFWFRLPGDYDFPFQVQIPGGDLISPESFSRVLVHLNFWEKFEYEAGSTHERPISLTVGLKKTKRRGLNIFARYDSGGEHHDGSTNYLYTAPDSYKTLETSLYTGGSNQYDFLGFWLNSDQVFFQEGSSPSYASYRALAHRSAEVNVSLKNQPECGPRTWHRASVFWNLGWNSSSEMLSKNQLHIELHDGSNKLSSQEFHQGVEFAPSTYNPTSSPNSSFNYPQDDSPTGGSAGFMLPFDSAMILSLGESHARRLAPYTLNFTDLEGEMKTRSSEAGKYGPRWRFNSEIDNFRLRTGPQTPVAGEAAIPDTYFDPDFLSSTFNSNLYGALRYEVIHQNHGFPMTKEPKWVITPNIPAQWALDPIAGLDYVSAPLGSPPHPPFFDVPAGSKLYAIGTRIYYPPDSNNNFPYIHLASSNQLLASGEPGEPIEPSQVSTNEQDMIYSQVPISNDFRIWLQYKAFKPSFDGDLSNIEAEPLIYAGSDNWTNIGWVKEVSTRIGSSEIEFLSWQEE